MWVERWKTRADLCDHYKQINCQWANFGHKKTRVYIRVALLKQKTKPPSPLSFYLCHIEQHNQTMSYAAEMEAQSQNVGSLYLYNSAVIWMT